MGAPSSELPEYLSCRARKARIAAARRSLDRLNVSNCSLGAAERPAGLVRVTQSSVDTDPPTEEARLEQGKHTLQR
eukprot:scaffold2226_cov28-Tisochrysis_lutea.AAC.3